ncbi:MAG: hypothetical protein GY866_33320 [Proteobacteria bacterium]|nr:hypothetical protein [Pseudomonadota bacterium]
MTGEVVGDRLYVVGGQFMGSSGSETSILEIFDPSSSSSSNSRIWDSKSKHIMKLGTRTGNRILDWAPMKQP